MAVLLVACGAPAATGSLSPASTSQRPPSTAPASASDPARPSPGSSAPAASPSLGPAAWSQIGRGPAPSPREDHTWTLVGDGGVALLFGGRDEGTVHGDLWSYDLATDAWEAVETDGGPPPRFGHEAVWVDGIGLVVFAGQAGATFYNDLWAFDPGSRSWRQLPSVGDVPVPRYGTCMALGPDGRLWISHGFTSDGTRFADTRAWDPASGAWTDETPDGDLPVSRCLHACWWTADGRLSLYAGQTTGTTALDDRWVLDAGAWRRLGTQPPAARNLYARARLGDLTLVVGGQAVDGSYLGDGWWLPDAESAPARPLEVDGPAPPPRAGAELVHDVSRDRVLLFGGRDAAGARNDLWELRTVSATRP
jgi:hypothetical protein